MSDNLKEYIKDCSIDTILSSCTSQAMGFMADKISELELLEHRKICCEEIERRINNLS